MLTASPKRDVRCYYDLTDVCRPKQICLKPNERHAGVGEHVAKENLGWGYNLDDPRVHNLQRNVNMGYTLLAHYVGHEIFWLYV